jgi:hypothetical protein
MDSMNCRQCGKYALGQAKSDDVINNLIMQRYLNQGITICSLCRKQEESDFGDYQLHDLIKSYRPDLKNNRNEVRELATAFKKLLTDKPIVACDASTSTDIVAEKTVDAKS